MLGTGLLQGLAVTAKNLVGSFHDPARYVTQEYPEVKTKPPENYRNFPFLVSENAEDPMGTLRCVACQICEKECPPQCIYIEKSKDKKPDATGKLQLYPMVFDLDTSVCMSCQICVEVCPVEAIKMDQVFEIATEERFMALLLDRNQLAKPNSYFHQIHPTDAAEVDARLEAERKAAAEKAPNERRRRRQSRRRSQTGSESAHSSSEGGVSLQFASRAARRAPTPDLRMILVAPPTDSVLERAPLLVRDFVIGFFPEPLRWWVGSLLAIVVLLSAFGLLFAFLTLAERKILGRVQNRPGPNRTGYFGLLQPFADGIKMLTKEDIVPRAADPLLHFLAPVALVAFSLLTLAIIPFGRHLVPLDLDSGLLYFFAAGAATELAVFMAGWSSHNKYSLLAAMRALAQLISYELPLLLSVVPVVMLAGTLSLTGIVAAQSGWTGGVLPHWHVFTPWGAVSFALFLVAALAESNRSPFDLPEAESELIAGHLTEYSGFKYALFFMAEYFGMCALSGLAVTLFLGGWQAPCAFLDGLPSYLWFAVKLLAVLLGFIWVRATLPRLRIDQLTRLAWKFLVPLALINLGTAAFWELTAGWSGALHLVRWAAALALIAGPFAVIGRRLMAGIAPRIYRYAPS